MNENTSELINKLEELHKPLTVRFPNTNFTWEICVECSRYEHAEMFARKIKYPCNTIKLIRGT